jgi:Ca2+/Na+ antiporter
MNIFAIVNSLGELLMATMFSTRGRPERELLDDDLGEEDGYFI